MTKFFSAISGQELNADLNVNLGLEHSQWGEYYDEPTELRNVSFTLHLDESTFDESRPGFIVYAYGGELVQASASYEDMEGNILGELEIEVNSSIENPGMRGIQVFFPEEIEGEVLVKVEIDCLFIRELPTPRRGDEDENPHFLYYSFDTPIPVAEGMESNSSESNVNLDFHDDFSASSGMYIELSPLADLSRYPRPMFVYAGITNAPPPKGDLTTVPSLFADDSEHIIIRGGTAFSNQSFFAIDANNENISFEEQRPGRNLKTVQNASVFSTRTNRVSGKNPLDEYVSELVVDWGLDTVFNAAQSALTLLDGVENVDRFSLIRQPNNQEIPVFMDRDREFIEYIFSSIDSSNYKEDHPFYFDASKLIHWKDSSIGFRQILSSLDAGMSQRLSLGYFLDVVDLFRVMMPSLEDASEMKLFSPLEYDNVFQYRADSSSSAYTLMFEEKGLPHLPTHFLYPELPVGATIVDTASISKPNLRFENRMCVVFRKTEWIGSLGIPVWVFGQASNEYAIYREIPEGTKVVYGFNSDTSGHLFTTGTLRTDGWSIIDSGLRIVPQPRLPEGVEYVFGYYENMLTSARIKKEVETPFIKARKESVQTYVHPELFDAPTEEPVIPFSHGTPYTWIEGNGIPVDGTLVIPALPESTKVVTDYMTRAFQLGLYDLSVERYGFTYLQSLRINFNVLGEIIDVIDTFSTAQIESRNELADFISFEEQELPNLELVDGWAVGIAGNYLSSESDAWIPMPPKRSDVRYKRLFSRAFRDWSFQGNPGSHAQTNRRAFNVSMFSGYNVVDDESLVDAFNSNFYGDFDSIEQEYGVSIVNDAVVMPNSKENVLMELSYESPRLTSQNENYWHYGNYKLEQVRVELGGDRTYQGTTS